MMQLRNQMDHFPRVRYKVDARHDLVYFEIDRPGDLSQQEIDQIFEAIELTPRFVGQIPEELRLSPIHILRFRRKERCKAWWYAEP